MVGARIIIGCIFKMCPSFLESMFRGAYSARPVFRGAERPDLARNVTLQHPLARVTMTAAAAGAQQYDCSPPQQP
jgi:hypothetical protein